MVHGPEKVEISSEQDAVARWERIARRVARASSREGSGPAGQLRLELTEALLVAHDLFMLGEISTAPTLRWDVATAQTALAPWAVTVVADGALTWDAGSDRREADLTPTQNLVRVDD